MSGSVALDRPLPTPTPANGYKHKKLRSYPKKATETSSEESYPDQMLTPPPQQNGCGSVSETPSPPMVYQIPHSNGGPRVTPSPPIPMDCQLFPPPTMVPHCSIKSELPSPPSLTFEQQHHPFTLYRMEVEKSHGVRHVNPLQLPPSQIPPIEWFSRLGLGMVSPGLSLHGHQIPHLHHLPPALLSMNRYHPYARHHLPHPPSSCVSMGIPPPLPIGQPPVCQLPAGTTLEKVPGDNQLLPQTQQHQQVGAGSISPSLASSSSRSSLDGGGPIRRRKKQEDIPDWVKLESIDDFKRNLEMYCRSEEERAEKVELRRKIKNRDAAQRSRQKRIGGLDKLKHEHNQYTQLLRKTELKSEEVLEILEKMKKERAELLQHLTAKRANRG